MGETSGLTMSNQLKILRLVMWCSNVRVNNVYVCMQSDVCTTLVIACLAY